MRLVIARHGEAEYGTVDSERVLTESGKNDVILLSQTIKAIGWEISEICHSPLLRAAQTAKITHEILGGTCSITTEKCLKSGSDVDDIMELLHRTKSDDTVIYVFHAPEVSRLAARLTDLSESSFNFPPGGMLALNLPVGHPRVPAQIIWSIQPEIIRKMAKLQYSYTSSGLKTIRSN